MSEKRFKLTKLSTGALDEVSKDLRSAYVRIVRLMEEEVLSNDEFEFWTEATHALLDAAKRLDALAARADG